eukprot:TRINITY_DN89023_c0_g1_i2.p1 TRINITY_DN89023_c0_g1~~TRINITY_DN89023_c0_g1_i2.p1  ORF type:complete len:171 (+),score=16.38 TRINITY_DN89023_c0_g1_i2:124-636(+)
MNSELSKYIEEGLKSGQVSQPSLGQNSSKTQLKKQTEQKEVKIAGEISSGLVWKGLFAFILALGLLLWILTNKSAQKQDEVDKEFQISNNSISKNQFNLNKTILNAQNSSKIYEKDGLLCVEGKDKTNFQFCHPVDNQSHIQHISSKDSILPQEEIVSGNETIVKNTTSS